MKPKWRGTTAAERTSSPPPKKVKVDAVDLRMVQSAIEHLKEENERLASELSRVAEEARREEQKRIEPLIWMAWRDLEWHRCRGAKPAMVPMLAPSVCRELLRAAGVDPDGPPPPEVESYQRRIKGEER